MDVTSSAAAAKSIESLPAPLQAVTRRWFERFADDYPDARIDAGQVAAIVRLVAVSDFAGRTLLREWPEVEAQGEAFWAAPDRAELDNIVTELADNDDDTDAVKAQLRRHRNRMLLRILNREVAGVATLDDTLHALSDLADRLLDASVRFAMRALRGRFGDARTESGEIVPIVILGMGKLGGRELNFSSDIDIIFTYPVDAETDGRKRVAAAEYFARLSRLVVALLEEPTPDGFAFRVDTRLRPFGDSGPPVVSFAALESYLVQHGRAWERYAYVKARVVGPRPPQALVDELFDEVITPFVYRRYLDFGVFESLREMQSLIAAEVQRRELADNVKLGPGGIREIEFIVQSLQLVRGGSRAELRGRNLQAVLPRLVGRRGLSAADSAALQAAYRFLRRLENFIQGLQDRQLHELPGDATDRARLCLAMGYHDWEALLETLDGHRRRVTAQFARVAFRDSAAGTDNALQPGFENLWNRSAAAAQWSEWLHQREFADSAALAETLAVFVAAPATQRIDAVSMDRLRQFMALLLQALQPLPAPATILPRILAIVEQILRRSAYLALLIENVSALERLVNLCAESARIAEQIARYPMLLDELLDPRIHTIRVTQGELDGDLDDILAAAGELDDEAQMELLARFQRASQFRIAVADINGSLPVMRVSDSLTDLAETVLSHALQIAWSELSARHGVPRYTIEGSTFRAGFGIVAYGKFGGIELSYGSDLDLVFLHDSQGENQQTDGEKPLANTMFFTRLVRRLVHLLTTQTGSGALYEVDMRLRPDGRSGLLVTSLDAFERYQEENAWTWEHQALLRARPVAGSALIAREFERIRIDTLARRVRREVLRVDVASMRQRMRGQLDRSDSGQFDLKQGAGGIADIEFIVQYLVLDNAGSQRAVTHYTDNIRQLATLAATSCLDPGVAAEVQDIYRRYRLRAHHLALDSRPPLVAAGEFATERAAVAALWAELFADRDT